MLRTGDIVVKRDCKIVALKHIPVRTPCVIHTVTHGEPYYWLRDAHTNVYIGGMCAELMQGFRKVRRT